MLQFGYIKIIINKSHRICNINVIHYYSEQIKHLLFLPIYRALLLHRGVYAQYDLCNC